MVVYLVTTILQIFHRMCRWKNFWKSVYSVSQKKSPYGFLKFFCKKVGNF